MTTPLLTEAGHLQKIDWRKIENPLAPFGIAPGESLTLRHFGPGPHPGTGTSQGVHAPIKLTDPEGWYDPDADFPTGKKFHDWLRDAMGIADVYYGQPDPEKFEARGAALVMEDHEGNQLIAMGNADDPISISIGGVFASKPGTGLGSLFMEVMKYYANKTNRQIDIWAVANQKFFRRFPWLRQVDTEKFVYRHYGPGPHPGTGTPQDVHGGDGFSRSYDVPQKVFGDILSQLPENWTEGIQILFSSEDDRSTHWPGRPEFAIAEGDIYGWLTGTDLNEARVALQGYAFGHELVFETPEAFTEHLSRQVIAHEVAHVLMDRISPEKQAKLMKMAKRFEHHFDSKPINQYRYYYDQRKQEQESAILAQSGERRLMKEVNAEAIRYYLTDRERFAKLPKTYRDAIENIFAGDPMIRRHYGPGPHPGTGTSQDVHGGDGLGELRFGDPHYRNNIKFNIPMGEALRMGLNQGDVNVLGVEFHQQLMRAIQDMESALGFPIQGLSISNDLLDFAVAVYGKRVLDNPTYREDTFGKLRAEALGWRGAYYKGVVWLDESLNTIMGPISMENPTWQESVWHEVAHYLTGWDGRVGFSPAYTSSMWHENSPLSDPSDEYRQWVTEHYGDDIENTHDEYRADLVAAWIGSQLDGKPPKWRRRFTGLQGSLPKQDLANMENLIGDLIEEGRSKAGLVERAGPDRKGVLVLFKTTGELKVVSRKALKTLPDSAEVIGPVFDR